VKRGFKRFAGVSDCRFCDGGGGDGNTNVPGFADGGGDGDKGGDAMTV
jgi:hypothetical protein